MKVFKPTNNWRRVLVLSACFVFTLTTLESCKKDPTSFGINTLNPDDLIASGGKDTFNLVTYSVPRDSIATQNQSNAILGTMHDPKTGIFKASFYSQFDFEGTLSIPSGSVATIDSVVLGLKYVTSGANGKLDAQTFEVYRVNEALYYDSNYYRSTITQVTGSNLILPGDETQTPDFINKPNVADTATPPQLRFRLQNSFGQQFIDDLIAGNSAFSSHDEFKQNYFKGLRISTTATNPPKGTGGIVKIDINNKYTYLNIYYHLQGDPTAYVLNLARRADCLFYNQVDVNHSGYHIAQVLADSTYGTSQFYTQAFTTQACVAFPTVSDLPKNSFIHSALLFLPVEFQTYSNYLPSSTYTVSYKNDANEQVIIGYAQYSDELKGVVLDLTKYIQQITLGNYKNRTLYIYQFGTFNQSAERTIFNGSNTSYKSKPKLIIKSSEFE